MRIFLDIIDRSDGKDEIVASVMADKEYKLGVTSFSMRQMKKTPIRCGMLLVDSDGRYRIVKVAHDASDQARVIMTAVLDKKVEAIC